MKGTWSTIGYSRAFSLRTDATGNASLVIRTKTTKGQAGIANISLEEDTTTFYTEAITIEQNELISIH